MPQKAEYLKSGSLIEWLVPLAFIVCAAWVTWHMPAFILDWGVYTQQLDTQFDRLDVTPNMPVVLGEHIDVVDLLALLGLPLFAVIGVRTVRRAAMEFEAWGPLDRLSVFIGRVTMMLIVLLTSVMIYEVILRYVFEAPTLWANELSLWIASFIFLLAGLYAMQQRSHIRITMLYDVVPKWLRHFFDILSTALILIWVFATVWGGFNEAVDAFKIWELYDSAWAPPIPAITQPLVLIITVMVGIQAVSNLIMDWNEEGDGMEVDEMQVEIEEVKRAQGLLDETNKG